VSDTPALAFIGVGSNIRPEENVRKALQALSESKVLTVVGISTFYRTAPLPDPADSASRPEQNILEADPDFLNGVLEVRTVLKPDGLLALLGEIEKAMGRRRPSNKYAPRTLDLDLLLFGELQEGAPAPVWKAIGQDGALAHRDIERRAFVAHPLFELAPDLSLPPHGVPLRAFASSFDTPGGLPEEEFTRDLRSRFLPS
jgi:2-amino-4-hydroxy-6-hydroxymethyldihydropteridine diphosphokinase